MRNNSKYLNKFTRKQLEEDYNNLKSLKAVGRKYGVAADTIKNHMNRFGLEYAGPIRYECNHNYFSTNVEGSFYLAGFVAADGSISEKRKALTIGLSSKDIEHLKLIKNLLDAENPINNYLVKNSTRNPKWNDTEKSEFRVVSRQIIHDLKRFNIISRKTKTLTFPDWLKVHPLRHHFIRGYFDGDGSFYEYLKPERDTKQLYFSLRGTKEFLAAVREIFDAEIDLPKKSRLKSPRLNNGIYILEYGGNRIVEKIFNYLYQDATVYMQRKYDIGIQAQNLGDTRDIDSICTKENLIKTYEKYNSLSKAAKKLEISSALLYNRLNEYGYKFENSSNSKNKRFQKELTKERIQSAYNQEGSIRAAARKLGIGATTLKRYMNKYDITL